jgi:flagellar biosynthetic protein FliR
MDVMPFDLTTWLLVFLRAGAWLSIFPLFTMQNFPVQLRIALGALVSFLVSQTITAPVALPHGFFSNLGMMVAEVGSGLLLGFICRLVFHILEFAGNLVSSELGLNMASTLNPFTHGRSDIPGTVLYYLGALLFLVLDLHHALLLAFQKTYVLLPFGAVHLKEALFNNVIGSTSQLFALGLLMAAPIIAVSFLVNLVFSVLGRAVPQMNVFSESFPFRIMAGLTVFGLSLNLMAQHISNYLSRLPQDFLRVAQLLGGA